MCLFCQNIDHDHYCYFCKTIIFAKRNHQEDVLMEELYGPSEHSLYAQEYSPQEE